jgi:hypothetical protein
MARFEGESEGSNSLQEATSERARVEPVRTKAEGLPTRPALPVIHARSPATFEDVVVELAARTPSRRAGLELTVRRVMTRRENAILEWLLGGWQSWTAIWGWSAVACLVASVGSLLLPGFSGLWTGLGCLALASAVPLLGGIWPGFEPIRTGGVYCPLLAPYPVGYAEASSVMLKTNLIRFIAVLPLVVLVGSSLTSGTLTLTAVMRVLLVVVAAHPAAIVIKFARGTNDLERFRAKCLAFFLILPAVGLAVVGAGLLVSGSSHWETILGLAMVAGPAWLLLLGYGLAYGRPYFDLVRTEPDELSG